MVLVVFVMVRRLGVQRLHALQFLVGQVRQMPYEMHQLPASSILIHVAFRPGRHRSEADAIANDKEQFTVGHRLNLLAAQVRYPWIHVFTDLCLTAAVIGMATGAMVGKMVKPLRILEQQAKGAPVGIKYLDVVPTQDHYAIVLLLPDEQPRPAGDVAAARAVAVLATPATLALDVVEFAAVAAILVPMVALGLAPNC